jgi:HAE1 family hydrophobic/amphiphilic exporter-1
MGMVAVALFGVLSWFRMDREFMPAMDFPQLVVLTSYSNASSQEVENLVTKPVEEAAGTVKNVQRIHSASREGISIVTVEFVWGTNMDVASLNLREKVDLAKAKLPREAGEPRVEKFNPFALPVITLSLSGPWEDHELLTLARRPVGELLEKARGVAAVTITGGREREIQVDVDQSALASRGLPIVEVGQALSRSNITYPAGQVKDNTFEYVVRVLGAFNKVQDLNRVAVAVDRARLSSTLTPNEAREKKRRGPAARQAGQPILLGDVAHVKDGFAEEQSYSRYDGRATVTLAVLKQAESNVVRVADDVKARLDNIRSKLPAGARLDIVYDQSTFVKDGLRGMWNDSLLGGLLAFLILLVFLGTLKEASTVSIAIPISLLATVTLMEWKGLSLNTITLAGLAIGVGNLVDGAIVVQENISRHRAMGKAPEEAAIMGAREVFGAVTSSNLTTIAVFFPLIFVTGLVGQIFGGLSWAVIFSNLTSQVAAFTVIPMLAAARQGEGKVPDFVNRLWSKVKPLGDRYTRALSYALVHPGRVVGWTAAAFAVSITLLSLMPRTLFPKAEGKEILLRLDLPAGSPLSRTNEVCLSVERTLKEIPGIAHTAVTVGSIPQEGLQPLGPNQAQIVLALTHRHRPRTGEIVALIQEKFKFMKAARLYAFEQGGTFSFLGGGGGAPVAVEVKGSDLAVLEDVAQELMGEMKSIPGLSNVRTSISERAPELQLNVRREALADVSLSVSDLAETALTALKGKVVSKFREVGREIDIRLRLRKADRESPLAVSELLVHSPLDLGVPLGSVAHVQKGHGPSEILRFDQERTILVSADLAGRSLANISRDVERILAPYKNRRDVSLTPTGEAARMAESFRNLKIVLALSILFVFMIMAAQFESLWEPFLILFSIPFSLIGMAPALFLFGHEVSAMAGMGVVLLAGIVVNNGIVLIDFVNQSRNDGLPLIEGLRNGCSTRLRPILMTALTTILGMTPLALGLGEGADLQAPLAVVVVSGLLVSTVLTLLVLPALFVLVDTHLFNPAGRKAFFTRIAHLKHLLPSVRESAPKGRMRG